MAALWTALLFGCVVHRLFNYMYKPKVGETLEWRGDNISQLQLGIGSFPAQ